MPFCAVRLATVVAIRNNNDITWYACYNSSKYIEARTCNLPPSVLLPQAEFLEKLKLKFFWCRCFLIAIIASCIPQPSRRILKVSREFGRLRCPVGNICFARWCPVFEVRAARRSVEQHCSHLTAVEQYVYQCVGNMMISFCASRLRWKRYLPERVESNSLENIQCVPEMIGWVGCVLLLPVF